MMELYNVHRKLFVDVKTLSSFKITHDTVGLKVTLVL